MTPVPLHFGHFALPTPSQMWQFLVSPGGESGSLPLPLHLGQGTITPLPLHWSHVAILPLLV